MTHLRGPLGLLLFCTWAICGCGYTAGEGGASAGYQWKSLYRPDIKTVAISIFNARDFRRGEEFRLTSALARQVEAYTPYKIVAREKADTIIEGEIRRIERPVMFNTSDGGVPGEQLFVLTVDFTWKDLRSGKIIVSRQVFEQVTAYYPTLGEGSFVGAQTAAEKLAQAIVQQMEADW